MNELLKMTAERASAYLDGLKTRNVFPTQEALDGLARFDEPMPLSGAMKILKRDLRAPYWEGRGKSIG
jgi:hypothetical protein